jgi:hypothetical protein
MSEPCTRTEEAIWLALHEHGPGSAAEVARRSGFATETASTVLRRLCRLGLAGEATGREIRRGMRGGPAVYVSVAEPPESARTLRGAWETPVPRSSRVYGNQADRDCVDAIREVLGLGPLYAAEEEGTRVVDPALYLGAGRR